MPRRRSYDQHCAAARALDSVGDRWTLLIVRELLAGPRRYTDLHTDLPGISTDVLAARLRDMEREELTTRRRLPPPSGSWVYELSPRGHALLPVLTALAEWGAPALARRRPTDAVRAHWYALPLLRRLNEALGAHAEGAPEGASEGGTGVVDVALDEGTFHLRVGAAGALHGEQEACGVYGDGAAGRADARLAMSTDTCRAVVEGSVTPARAVEDGRIEVAGTSPLAALLRGAAADGP